MLCCPTWPSAVVGGNGIAIVWLPGVRVDEAFSSVRALRFRPRPPAQDPSWRALWQRRGLRPVRGRRLRRSAVLAGQGCYAADTIAKNVFRSLQLLIPFSHLTRIPCAMRSSVGSGRLHVHRSQLTTYPKSHYISVHLLHHLLLRTSPCISVHLPTPPPYPWCAPPSSCAPSSSG